MARRIKFYRRLFLNRPHHQSIALGLADLKGYHGWSPKRGPWSSVDAGLTLGDCGRQITLEFSARSDDNIDEILNVSYKSHVLRKLVNDFLDKVDESVEQIFDVRDANKDWQEANPDG
jgi:hypothetical protein